MFTRGEVGAGVIFIALGYSLGGPALIISVLTLVLNLILRAASWVGQETGPAHLRARSADNRLNNPIFTIKRRKP